MNQPTNEPNEQHESAEEEVEEAVDDAIEFFEMEPKGSPASDADAPAPG